MLDLFEIGWAGVFFALLIGHAFGDFALQSQFVSEAKCPNYWDDRKEGSRFDWVIVLSAHSLIHAGIVWLVTGEIWFAVAELILHGAIDKLKCHNRCSLLADQLLHVFCKVIYVGVIFL